MVATFVFPLLELQAPLDVDVGGVSAKAADPNTLDGTVNAPSAGVALLTTRLPVTLAPVKFPLAACVAVITDVPAPLTVTVLPLMVATFVLPLL
jgi:hypothetical protein